MMSPTVESTLRYAPPAKRLFTENLGGVRCYEYRIHGEGQRPAYHGATAVSADPVSPEARWKRKLVYEGTHAHARG